MLRNEKCTEVCAEWSEEADFSEAGVIKNVLLCGNKSRNGYGIPAKAFGDQGKTTTLYEGKMIFFNHNVTQPLHRNVQTDLAGVIRNVRLQGGQPRGDIDTRHTPAGQTLWEISQIRPQPKGLGLSHVAEYRFASPSREEVEEVAQVVSVDVVMTPATTNTLYEQDRKVEFEAELKVVRAERDKHAAELQTAKERVIALEGCEKDLKTKVETLTSECASLRKSEEGLKAKVDAFEAATAVAARREQITKELRDAKLNPEDGAVVTAVFLEQLVATASTETRTALIADRAALVASANALEPGALPRAGSKPDAPKAFDPASYLKLI